MTRKLILFCLLATLALSGCNRIKLPFGKKTVAAAPTPAASVPAPAPPPPVGESQPTAAAPENSAAPAPAAAAPAPANPASGSNEIIVDNKAQVVVLCYHRLEGKAGGALSIEPSLFEEHMQKIKEAGLSVISMQDFLAWRRNEKNIPAKSVIITIDDGYVSGYEVGWPILKKYGYPFTMFVYLDYIGKGGKSVTWEQLEEMRDAGVDIGCHTVSHKDLKIKPKTFAGDYDAWLKDEVGRSKQVLEEKLGIKVATIAYPFGLHNEKVHAACKEAGYEAAFTTYGQRLGHSTPPFILGRYDVTTKDAQGHDSFSVAISFQGMMAPTGGDNTMGQDAAVSMITEPMNGETITNPLPAIKANLSTMGNFDPKTVQVRMSGVGIVASKFDPASKMMTATLAPNQKLKPGRYTVIVSATQNGQKLEASWNFHFDPNGTPGAAKEEPLPPKPPKR